jgi:hypothetical protein
MLGSIILVMFSVLSVTSFRWKIKGADVGEASSLCFFPRGQSEDASLTRHADGPF